MEGYGAGQLGNAQRMARDMTNACSAQPDRQPQISEQVAMLDASLSSACALFQDLAKQMTPLLRPTDEGACGPSAPVPMICPLADSLRGITERLSALAQHISQTRQRLEI